MVGFLKPISRKIHEGDEQYKAGEEGACTSSLTVWRKSLVCGCNGFTVFDSNGDLVFRVDNYIERPQEVILMDGSGKPVLTVCRRKKLRIVDNWFVYEGEVSDYSSKKPIWDVKKNINILHRRSNLNILAQLYRHGPSDKRYAYVIEGSYTHRSCLVLDESRKVVAEIKKKETMMGRGGGGGVSFGLEVFLLIIRPGFDHRFAMAIVLLLDQMFS